MAYRRRSNTNLIRLITDEGVAVGGAFDSDTANRHDAGRAPRRRCASVYAIVIHRQEVSPMDAVSAVGASLQSTIARLR
jgi:Na+-translocating ferredoxin:NAD+ oxidoreductase RnfC subunit